MGIHTHHHQQIQLPPRTLSSFIRITNTSSHTSSSTTLYIPTPTSTPPTTKQLPETETRTTKPTLMTRLRGRNARTKTTKTTTTVQPGAARPVRASRWGGNRRAAAHHTHTTTPVVRQRRHATIGDKISGAMMKLKGSLTRRPGVKAAGTRRMHGTDGKGSHRVY